MNFRRSLYLGLLLAACGGGAVGEVDETIDPSGDEAGSGLSTVHDTHVLARRDYRRCIYPLCGGFWVRDLNSPAATEDRYVSGFDFSQSTLPEELQAVVNSGGDNELIVLGRLGPIEPRFRTRAFIVKEAWRGLPGNAVKPTEAFFSVMQSLIVCVRAPCHNLEVTRVNRLWGKAMASDVDVTPALKPLVQADWVTERVLNRGAIVAGGLVRGADGSVTLSARQVFVKLPDRLQSCPRVAQPVCREGTVVEQERTVDRCTVPVGCTAPGVCARLLPVCEPGYSLVTWMSTCPRYACEPEFLF